jgi:hypothetical protein
MMTWHNSVCSDSFKYTWTFDKVNEHLANPGDKCATDLSGQCFVYLAGSVKTHCPRWHVLIPGWAGSDVFSSGYMVDPMRPSQHSSKYPSTRKDCRQCWITLGSCGARATELLKIRAPMCSLDLAVDNARTSKCLDPQHFELYIKAFDAAQQSVKIHVGGASSGSLLAVRPFAAALAASEEHPALVAAPAHADDTLLFTIKSQGQDGHFWHVQNLDSGEEELWTVESRSRDVNRPGQQAEEEVLQSRTRHLPSLGKQHYWHTTERHQYVDSRGTPTKGAVITPLLDIVPTVYTPEAPAPSHAPSH